MKKRLLALILCLVMVIGLVPTAFAGSEEPSEPVDELNLVFIPDNDGLNRNFWRLAEKYHFKQGAVSAATDAVQASEMTAPTGKHFVGWSKTQGDKTDIFKFGTDSYPNQVTLTLYGIWEPDQTPDPDPVVKNTVTYKWDENSTTVKVCEVNAGEYHTVINYPTEWQLPDKKVFDHWTDGTKDWLPGQNYGAGVGNDVLYAVYKVAETALCTVAYDKAPNLTRDTFQIAVDQNVVIDPNGGAYFDATDRENNGKTDWFALPITKDTTIGPAKAAGKIFSGWVKGT